MTVPAVFNNSAIVKAAEDSEQKEMPKSPTVINGYVYETAYYETGVKNDENEATDKDGKNYGLLHSDNTWLQTQEFSWAVDKVFSMHGENNVPYQRTNGLNAGNTVTKITYLLKDSPDIVINTNIKLKKLINSW